MTKALLNSSYWDKVYLDLTCLHSKSEKAEHSSILLILRSLIVLYFAYQQAFLPNPSSIYAKTKFSFDQSF